MDIPRLRAYERKAMKEWRELKNDECRRANFIEGLAVARAEKNDTSAVTELRRLRQIEEQRASGHRLRCITGKHKQAATTVFRSRQFDGDGNELQPLILDSQEDQEEAILAEYEMRLRLVQDRGLMTELFIWDFGYLGTGPAATEVLAGTYVPPPGTPSPMWRWFKLLKASNEGVPLWEPEITMSEFEG